VLAGSPVVAYASDALSESYRKLHEAADEAFLSLVRAQQEQLDLIAASIEAEQANKH
jgi:hypothetical protein